MPGNIRSGVDIGNVVGSYSAVQLQSPKSDPVGSNGQYITGGTSKTFRLSSNESVMVIMGADSRSRAMCVRGKGFSHFNSDNAAIDFTGNSTSITVHVLKSTRQFFVMTA